VIHSVKEQEAQPMMLDRHSAWTFGERWCHAWSAGDLDALMEPCAPMVRLSSPGVTALWGEDVRQLFGWDAVRSYFASELGEAGSPRALESVLVGEDALTVVYRRPGGWLGADVVELDDKGRVHRLVGCEGGAEVHSAPGRT
jgi:hypothetical protein